MRTTSTPDRTDPAAHPVHSHLLLFSERLAFLAEYLEVAVSLLVLAGLVLSVVPIFVELPLLLDNNNSVMFHDFLGHAFNLVIGIEFIKMLTRHSPGNVLEVLLYAIARHMVLDSGSAVDNLLAVLAIGLLFLIRKFSFVSSFSTAETEAPAIHLADAEALSEPETADEQDMADEM